MTPPPPKVKVKEEKVEAIVETVEAEIVDDNVDLSDVASIGEDVKPSEMSIPDEDKSKDKKKVLTKLDRIKETVAGINKKFGINTATVGYKNAYAIGARISTGSLLFDYALGGGVPVGKFIQYWGEESAGKTTEAVRAAGNMQRLCVKCYTPLHGIIDPITMDYVKKKCDCGEKKKGVVAFIDIEGCIASDQEIFDPVSGFFGTVEEFVKEGVDNVHVLSCSEDELSVNVSKPSRLFDSGVVDTDIIKTKTTSLRATPDHPVLVWRGGPKWVSMKDIKIGDKVARPWRTKYLGEYTGVSLVEAELVGMLIGDGAIPEAGSVVFTKKDKKIWGRLSCLLDEIGYEVNIYDDRHGRLVQKEKHKYFPKGTKSPLNDMMSKFGLSGKTCVNKFVPKEIMNSTNDVISAVLSGLWMTDGTVNKARLSVSYSSVSKQLIIQIRWMLSRLGILGRVNSHENDDPNHRTNWIVTVNGYDNLEKFNDAVKLYSRKEEVLLSLLSKGKSAHRKPSQEAMLPSYNSSRHYRRRRNEHINRSDIWWDKVVEVTPDAGKIRCYDATVPKGSSWTVSDVIVHNTFDPEWAECLGLCLDEDMFIYSRPETGEESVDILEALIRSGDVDFVVFDSIAAMCPIEEMTKSAEEHVMGKGALLMNKGCRVWTSAMTDVSNRKGVKPTIIQINQIRQKIGSMYSDPTTRPGGNGQKFLNSIEVKMKKAHLEKEQPKEEGVVIPLVTFSGKVVKNKTARPFLEYEFQVATDDFKFKELTYKKGEIAELKTVFDLAHKYGLAGKTDKDFFYGEHKFKRQMDMLEKFFYTKVGIDKVKYDILRIMRFGKEAKK